MPEAVGSRRRLLTDDWLQTRRRLLRQLKAQVARRLGPQPDEIRVYARRFEREMRAPFKAVTKSELLTAVSRADLVFGGDFHAYAQAQRTHLKILRALPPTPRPLVLALEAFSVSAQRHIDAYLQGKISEQQLLARSEWKTYWGFPWEHYRPLVEFARLGGHHVLALGAPGYAANLREREEVAAGVLRSFFANRSARGPSRSARPLVYVVFGELHLASAHLPRLACEGMVGARITALTVHVNSESLYFSLAEKGVEADVDVVRLGRGRYCVLTSPPWVQWQSYLMFLENAQDRDLRGVDGDGDEDEDGDEGDALDVTDHVARLIDLAAGDLGVRLKADDVAVYSAADRGLWLRLKETLGARELRVARRLIESGRSFFLPAGGLFYLSRPTINHAAELAGQYLHARLCGRTRPLWRLPGDFQALIWTEAVGFFVSKLINHKRQAETLTDLRMRLEVLSPRDQGREALVIAIEQRLAEILRISGRQARPPRFQARSVHSRLEAARILGGMMGERLYLAVRSRKISLSELLKLMMQNPAHPDFDACYDEIMRRLGPGTGALRTRKDRL